MTESMRALLAGLIDYAGLFPPAKLPMDEVCRNYAVYLSGEHAFALGKLKCRVSQLGALSERGAVVMPGTYATSGYTEMAHVAEAWTVSAVIDRPLEESIDAIDAFNERHSDAGRGLARITALEMKIEEPGDVDEALDEIPSDIAAAFELPASAIFGGDPRGFVAALAGGEARAKVRCGGLTPDAFPSCEDLARFIGACIGAEVAFEATAGLHHPVRAEHALTYEANAPRGVMHGFLNVFIGASLARCRAIGPGEIVAVLEERDPSAFEFTDEACGWQGRRITREQLVRCREAFCVGYGSCSFTEPLEDLGGLGLV